MTHDLTTADVFTLKRLRDSGYTEKVEAVRREIARRLAHPMPKPGAYVVTSEAGKGDVRA
jgi:hypothetical protein